MAYFSNLDIALTEDGVITPSRRRRPVAFATRTVRCYRRPAGPICVPCSDIEDRDHPATVRGDALCCACGERLDER